MLADYPNGLSHDELAIQTANLYAQAVQHAAPAEINEAAVLFVADSGRFRPYSWIDDFLQGLCDYGVAPIIISGAPVEVLAAWAKKRAGRVAACFGLEAPSKTSAALSSRFLTVTPRQINPATADGKQDVVDQLKRARRRILLGVGDSVSDTPLWDAADNRIYMGTAVAAPEGSASVLTVESPADCTADDLLRWVRGRFGARWPPALAMDVEGVDV
jgi:hypothetical protein